MTAPDRTPIDRMLLIDRLRLAESVRIALTGGCGLCDTDAVELCAACKRCRCHRHDDCTRPEKESR
ncbi:hypothetical protein [Streptomyces sp. URMC 124]|uniref:hypothetical protein n=1 Tax=Streptomyces sp. URMC 124 TaxID=3423405 RepID=UPI003F1BF35D